MPSRVLLTVDTEFASRHHVPGGDWRPVFERSYDPAGVGIPHQLRLLGAHGLKACFFVDPMPALLYGIEPVRRMVEPILEAGQEVQLHLHSFWQDLAEGRPEPRYELTCCDAEEQRALIEKARELLVLAGAPDPIAFRSGSYAANADTVSALVSLGFRYDSSHNGCDHPWPSALPLDPTQIAPAAIGGLVEIPVTQLRNGSGKLRHLQLCALSSSELHGALLHAARNNHPVATIVSHSFELATRDGLRPNPLVAGRFETLCRFLADHRDSLPTSHVADLGPLPLDAAAEPYASPPVKRIARMAEQFWGNAVYERAL